MKKLVIFGSAELGEVAQYFFEHDSPYEVAAFTLDGSYIKENSFHGKPVVPFEDLSRDFPAEEYELFVALSYAKHNVLRERKYLAAKAKGYKLASYISSKATVWPDLSVGDNCFILEDNTIQPYVKIGNNVTLWSGNHIGHHAEISDNCFLASHIVVSGGVKIGRNCFIGVNATLHDHISIADFSILGAASIISSDTLTHGLYKPQATVMAKQLQAEPIP